MSAVRGADFILLNPLHALDIRYPENASPYSPIDRRFLNPLYIDLRMEESYSNSPAVRTLVEEPDFSRELSRLRQDPEVDYPEVFKLKYKVFDAMYSYFRERHIETGSNQAKEFTQYIAGHDGAIITFAQFQAAINLPGVQSCHEPEFHLFLQWLADRQLASCQALALELGMKVGIIRDLAVGGGSESCEVSTNPNLFCLEARIGAPPDNFNPDGQNWGLPPLRPDMLRQSHFSHFITLLRENMVSCGALRIDHIMALMRLWWCPTDGSNASGAYVHYPVDELFAILRLESRRAKCAIIGEDLGVVPPEIRAYIDGSGILSNVVFYFEKYDEKRFRLPHDYPTKALAIVANHDVPTLKAWWNTDDLKLRRELGLIASDARFTQPVAGQGYCPAL